MEAESHNVFATRAEAEAARDRRNADLPVFRYAPWWVGRPVDGKWTLVQNEGVTAEDLGGDPRAYEEAFCAAVERSAMKHDYWRELEGIRVESVSLSGAYPVTKLVKVFRPVLSPSFRSRNPSADCRFGIRWPIWPAEYKDPEEEAIFHDVYFMEALGTEASVYEKLNGTKPCDPARINWLGTSMD